MAAVDDVEGTTEEQLLAEGWQALETAGHVEFVGRVYFRPDGDLLRYGFIAGRQHCNRRGVIHGGILAAFADRALAMAGRRINNNTPQATIELSLRFIDTVEIGKFVECLPEVVRNTRSVIFVRGTLTVGSRIVATADGIWKRLSSQPARQA